MWDIFIYVGTHILNVVCLLSVIVRVDSKGRITLPKEVRERYGIVPGSKVLVEVKGRGEVLVRVIEKDPSEELAELLGDFTFTRESRVKAEKLLFKEAM